MRVDEFIKLLQMFPDKTEVLVQTCQGDLMQPLTKWNMWVTEAFIDEKYKTLEPARLVVTSYITSDTKKTPVRTEYRNPHSGVLVKYEKLPEAEIES